MKGSSKILLLSSGILIILTVALYSCGGYGGGGGMMSGGTAPPGAFSLVSPANGAIPVGTTPTLTWMASANATTGYEVQVELATGTFTGTTVPVDVVVSMTTLDFPVLMSAGLVKGTQYHWRVKAENIYGSMIAGPFTFTP